MESKFSFTEVVRNLRKAYGLYTHGHRAYFALFIIMMAIWATMNTLIIKVFADLVKAILSPEFDKVMLHLCGGLLFFVATDLVARKVVIMSANLNNKIFAVIKGSLIHDIHDMNQQTFEERSKGTYTQVFTEDVKTLLSNIYDICDHSLRVIAYFCVLIYVYYINVWFGAYLTLTTLLRFSIQKSTTAEVDAHDCDYKSSKDELISLFSELINKFRDIKQFSSERLFKKSSELIKTQNDKFLLKMTTKENGQTSCKIIHDFSWTGAFIILYVLYNLGNINESGIIALLFYLDKIESLSDHVMKLMQLVQDSNNSLSRVLELTTGPKQQFGTEEFRFGDIIIQNLKFWYDRSLKPALNNICIKISRGSAVVIAGKSGSGKTTLLNLLHRAYDYHEGFISIGGRILTSLSREAIVNHIAVVSQQPNMLEGSIEELFKDVKPNITNAEIKRFCKRVGLHDRFKRDNYQTFIGSNNNLSGGERQRLAIALALAKGASILLFDEPTSALDAVSRQLITKLIFSLKKDHTIVIVSHDSDIISYPAVDNIIVIDNGYVVNNCHGELLERKKLEQQTMTISQDNTSEQKVIRLISQLS